MNDVMLAVRAIKLHAREAVSGNYCTECGWEWPCVTRRWAEELLEFAGWGPALIEALSKGEAGE